MRIFIVFNVFIRKRKAVRKLPIYPPPPRLDSSVLEHRKCQLHRRSRGRSCLRNKAASVEANWRWTRRGLDDVRWKFPDQGEKRI